MIEENNIARQQSERAAIKIKNLEAELNNMIFTFQKDNNCTVYILPVFEKDRRIDLGFSIELES